MVIIVKIGNIKKQKSPNTIKIRNNQNTNEIYKFEDNFFKNEKEAYVYFRKKYHKSLSIKVKFRYSHKRI